MSDSAIHDAERTEWRTAVSEMSETERAATDVAVRRSAGMCGDISDVAGGDQ